MDIYLKLFEVLFPVFFVIGIGYYLGKNNKKIDTTFITNFAANIGTPAMIIYAVISTGITFDIFKEYFWYINNDIMIKSTNNLSESIKQDIYDKFTKTYENTSDKIWDSMSFSYFYHK